VQKGRFGQVCNGDLLPVSGFEPRAVDPVVIPYTDYSIRPPTVPSVEVKNEWR